MKRKTFSKRAIRLAKSEHNAQKCLNLFAHHSWVRHLEITIEDQNYLAQQCDCGYIEVNPV